MLIRDSAVSISVVNYSVNEALEAQILIDRQDPGPYLVYADWLAARGDPRGELIAIQYALRHHYDRRRLVDHVVVPPSGHNAPALPEKDALIEAELALLGKHLEEWAGPVGTLARYLRPRWRYGFVEEIRLPDRKDAHPEVLSVLGRPAFRLLRSLTFGRLLPRDDLEGLVGRLVDREYRPPIEDLRLVGTFDPHERLADVSGLARAFPRLARLRIDSYFPFALGDVQWSRLRSLEVTDLYRLEGLAEFRRERFPALKTLVVSTDKRLLPQLRTGPVAHNMQAISSLRLKRLHLRGFADLADDLVEVLAESRVLRSLEVLDLTGGSLTERGARVILDNADRFRHLRTLAVGTELLRTSLVAELQTVSKRLAWKFVFG